MKFHDHTQNLKGRILTIQVLAFIALALLGGRLYFLQIVKGEYYETKAESQRVRLIPVPAPRGSILDRNGKILVDSRPSYNVVLSNELSRKIDFSPQRIAEYSKGLQIEPEILDQRLKDIRKQNEFEALVVKESASMEDIAWVEAHSLEYPELRIELRPQRFYPHGPVLAHVLGYVGEISKKQLEKEEYKRKGFRLGDIIGKGGLEQQYDESICAVFLAIGR